MGTHCSSELPRGHIFKSKSITMKLILLTALAAVALAEPEAEARYYGYNPGFYGYNRGYSGYGHQLQWPGVRAPGFSSTCFGCRGKRSAEADAEPGYYGYPYGSYGYNYGSYGYPHSFGYRSYGPGIAGHPGAATSFTYRSPQGLRGKRSAEADAEPRYYGYGGSYGYNYGSYGYPYGSYGYRAYGRGIAGHPTGTSFTYRSVQGLRGKRSAEADAEPRYFGYGGSY